jgi:RimJ/RimL family protein N-acetyltransferase
MTGRGHLCQARLMGHYGEVELAELVLSSERLTLRPWRLGDAEAVHEAMQDRATHEFLSLPDPYQHCDAVEFVTDIAPARPHAGTGLACALVENATGLLVGSADLRLPAPRATAAEIGYVIYPPGRQRGYAAEASRTLAAWAFDHSVGRVEIRCAVANLASAKSALNAGFRYEGVLRGDIATASGPADGAVFGRLADDPDGPVERRFAALPADGLSDGVLTLRAVQPSDAPAILEQEADPLTVGVGFSGRAPTATEISRMATRAGLDWLVGTAATFAMVDVASGRMAGSLRLRQAGPPNVGGVGYAVHPAFRGRGYTSRALRLLVRNVDGTFADEVRFALVNPRLG